MSPFARYIGIDYSGAMTPESTCSGSGFTPPRTSGTPEQVLLPSLDTYRILA